MIGQHDATGADTDRGSCLPDMGQHDGGRGRSDAGHAMMFGDPITVEAKIFGVNGEGGSVGEGFGDAAAFSDGDKVQNGKTDHRPHMGR